jgi:broad specificity phosphatase PhoE
MASSLKFIIAGFAALLLAACQIVPAPQSGTAYLVRHAEKVTSGEAMVVADPRDPPLTAAGEARAETLSDLLAGKGITAIYSTDYTRTRDTAAPLAAALGLDVKFYDPNDLSAFAARLKNAPKETVLVVGHSNTTPQLAKALGGNDGTPIVEKNEYDRLYVVDLMTGETVIERFGVRFQAVE